MSYSGVELNFGRTKAIVIGIIIVATLVVLASASIKIVDTGYRGILTHWNAVDLNVPPLKEGLHFVTPFQDNIIEMEVRTLKYEKSTTSASNDLQSVKTQITVNYHPAPESVHLLYKEVGLQYESRVIQPAIEETVKQITAEFNAEELITKRPLVKDAIQTAISNRLNEFHLVTEVVSITDFEFSPLFTQAIESKVEAQQNALRAENDLKRIQVEARQKEAQSIGIANANIAEAEGEAKAIAIINQALAQNPNYLEWLKVQSWDGKLPLVTGEGNTPFIQIPTGGKP